MAGFTGIIIEHAFMDNASDLAKLTNETTLKNMGIADATGIAKYFNLQKLDVVDVDEGTYTISSVSNSDLSLDVTSDSKENGTAISLNKKDNVDASQRFEIISTDDGEYKILSENSGKALDVKSGSYTSGTVVQQYEWNGTDAQTWRFVKAGDGEYNIVSNLGTYLTAESTDDGSSVLSCTKDESEAQKWTLETTEDRPVEDGVYTIASNEDSDKVFDISNSDLTNSGNVRLYTKKSDASQQYHIEYVSNGYYKITAEHSNLVLDVASGSGSAGANLQQYISNGTKAQLWKFVKQQDGSYIIKSKLGTAISLSSKSTANGTNINMAIMDEDDQQLWDLEAIEENPVDDGAYMISSAKNGLYNLTESGDNVQLNSTDAVDTQKYQVEYVSDGYYKIISKASNKALTVKNSSTSIKTNLCTSSWTGSSSQLWRFIKDGDNYIIKSKLGTFIDLSSGKVAESNNIWLYSFNGTAAQQWHLAEASDSQSTQPIEDGTYTIESNLADGKVLDIAGGSLKDKANVQLYTSNDTSAQRFEITYVGDGYYEIVSEKSYKSLDVAKGSTKAGANLWQYECNGTAAQLWKFIDAGDGYYYIKSKKEL